jgi:hypothetical protein
MRSALEVADIFRRHGNAFRAAISFAGTCISNGMIPGTIGSRRTSPSFVKASRPIGLSGALFRAQLRQPQQRQKQRQTVRNQHSMQGHCKKLKPLPSPMVLHMFYRPTPLPPPGSPFSKPVIAGAGGRRSFIRPPLPTLPVPPGVPQREPPAGGSIRRRS